MRRKSPAPRTLSVVTPCEVSNTIGSNERGVDVQVIERCFHIWPEEVVVIVLIDATKHDQPCGSKATQVPCHNQGSSRRPP